MIKLIPIYILMIGLYLNGFSQNEYEKMYYDSALTELQLMLEETQELNFKRAVFVTENAYLDNAISYDSYCNDINFLVKLSELHIKANWDNFLYDFEDKETVLKYATIFRIMTDSIPILDDDGIIYHIPFVYDFDDIWGKKDWSQMFVTKLLYTHKGNCHSLPYLYKIIAEELGVTAHLALAPNHIYIKHKSVKTGMYNTELTSATFPIDAWLMASGYIHTDAIRSGIYMDTLTQKQSIALCVVDLAKGYERKYGTGDGNFIMSCCDLALKYYPKYVNAKLLKAETIKNQFDVYLKLYAVEHASQVFHIKEAKELFDRYENLIAEIHNSGYRRMPDDMYLKWLMSLKQEDKYLNKKVTNFSKTQQK